MEKGEASADTHVDVTTEFFEAVERMTPGEIVASPYFDMLEGARALEIGNMRLDTGLMTLTKEELDFDSSEPRSAEEVASLMCTITSMYVCWVERESLLLTLYSCRYILDFLENYKACGCLDTLDFVNLRLHPDGKVVLDSDEAILVNKVLRAFVIAIVKLAGFTRDLAINVLYDEEDLMTRSMDLDLLTSVPKEEILEELKMAQLWLKTFKNEHTDTIVHYIKLARSLVQMTDIVHHQMQLFSGTVIDVPWASEGLASLRAIDPLALTNVPRGAISQFVQVDCNNKHIPSKVAYMDAVDAHKRLEKVFEDVRSMITQLSLLKNVHELGKYLDYTVRYMALGSSAITRAIFQAFLVRDDRSICGSAEDLSSVTVQMMNLLCCLGNPILEDTKGPEKERLSALLDDLASAMYLQLSIPGNNRSRQRQLNNRQILFLDSFQSTAESIELELYAQGVGDSLSPTNGVLALAISSFVHHIKLAVMLETLFLGFELALYKPWEAGQMYWYGGYLAQMQFDHLSRRVLAINKGKLAEISHLGALLKRVKHGTNKERYQRRYKVLLPLSGKLKENIAHIEQFLMPLAQAHHLLSSAVAQLLHAYGALGMEMAVPSADREMLYQMRMKPWLSVGVPELPSFADYTRSTEVYDQLSKMSSVEKQWPTVLGNIGNRFTLAKKVCDKLLAALEGDFKVYVEGLCKTCIAYKLEIMKLLAATKTGCKLELEMKKAYSAYFPLYGFKERL